MVINASSVKGFDFGGLLIRDYTAHTAGNSSVAEILAPVGSGHGRALSRRSAKYYYILEGEVAFEIDGSHYRLSKGDLAVIPVNTPFKYSAAIDSVRMLLIHTPPFSEDEEVFLHE
ncbi:MAG: cupin domain-containing protein [Acidimicrobiaceae bacterium]|nr:cupin domain-containing protein [Acidimicrobiaceae bacterium]